MSNKAIFIKEQVSATGAVQKVYKLEPPVTDEDYDGTKRTFEYVTASAVVAPFSGPETCIFGSDSDGNIEDFSELPGSYRGGLDHEAAINGLGYEVG